MNPMEAQQVENTASSSNVALVQAHTWDEVMEQMVEVARAWDRLLAHTVLCGALAKVVASQAASTWELRWHFVQPFCLLFSHSTN
jgi:hypothetical protein